VLRKGTKQHWCHQVDMIVANKQQRRIEREREGENREERIETRMVVELRMCAWDKQLG
jgi:hypothetical protein